MWFPEESTESVHQPLLDELSPISMSLPSALPGPEALDQLGLNQKRIDPLRQLILAALVSSKSRYLRFAAVVESTWRAFPLQLWIPWIFEYDFGDWPCSPVQLVLL